MVKLRVIGSSADHTELLLSNKAKGRRGTHSIAIDRRLLSVLQKAVYARRDAEQEQDNGADLNPRYTPTSVEAPKVPPREIQRMFRAGMSVQQVLRATDLDVAYIEQFLPPVLYERDGVVRDAQNLYTEKTRLGQSSLPLGEAVALNLMQRRVRLTEEQLSNAWTATRQEGEPWTIILSFPFRGRARRATWKYDPRSRTLVAANKVAQDMGWASQSDARTTVPRPGVTAVAPSRGARSGGAKRKAAPKKRAPAKRKPAPKKRAPAKRKAAPKKRAAVKRKAPAKRKAAPKKRAPAKRKAAPKKRAPAKRKAARRR